MLLVSLKCINVRAGKFPVIKRNCGLHPQFLSDTLTRDQDIVAAFEHKHKCIGQLFT